MSKGLSRLGLTLRLNWNEMQAVKNMTPKGKKEKDFAKYCMLVGLNQVVENAKKRFAEQEAAKAAEGVKDGNGQRAEGVSASSSEDASKSSSNSDLQQTELSSVRDDSGN